MQRGVAAFPVAATSGGGGAEVRPPQGACRAFQSGVPHGRRPSDSPGPGPHRRVAQAPETSQMREQGARVSPGVHRGAWGEWWLPLRGPQGIRRSRPGRGDDRGVLWRGSPQRGPQGGRGREQLPRRRRLPGSGAEGERPAGKRPRAGRRPGEALAGQAPGPPGEESDLSSHGVPS